MMNGNDPQAKFTDEMWKKWEHKLIMSNYLLMAFGCAHPFATSRSISLHSFEIYLNAMASGECDPTNCCPI